MEQKIHSTEYKKGPKQVLIGNCSHQIKPIQREGVMLRWCDTCDTYVEQLGVQLIPRKKGA